MRRTASSSLNSAVSPVVEHLERRQMLCDSHMAALLPPAPEWSEAREAEGRAKIAARGGPEATIIDWTNRGLTNDGFNATFGTSAETMRNIVDAALFAWQRVITNWNRSDGSTTLQVSISVGAPGTGFGGSAGPGAAPADRKPRTGSVSLGGGMNTADPNDSNGWFADPDPYDNAEFTGPIVNAYVAGNAISAQSDFFSLVTIEMAHVLGLISDPNNAGGGFENYPLEDFVTDTGIADNAHGGGNGTFRVFNGPTVRHLMTSFNSGSSGTASWGNVIHTAGLNADINFQGVQWRGSDDTGNATYFPSRYLPSFADAHIFKDAYGYSIAEPMTFGTMYAIIDETSGRLTIRGATGNTASNDQINVSFINGSTIRVSVDVGNDAPGTGALPGPGNLPPFVTDFLAIGVTEIVIDAGDGNDSINVESLPFFADATLRGGGGNDYIQFSRDLANLDNVAAPIFVDGGIGSDTVLFHDYNALNSAAYAVGSNAMSRPGAGAYTISSVERRELYGARGDNAFNIASSTAGTEWLVAGGIGGNDVFNVGLAGGNADLIDGTLLLFGEVASDTLNYNDGTSSGPIDYGVTANQISRTGNATLTYGQMENVVIHAGSGDNDVTLAAVAGTPPTVTVNGNNGNDDVIINLTDAGPLGFGGQFNGNGGTDSIRFDDARASIFIGLHADTVLGGFIRQHDYGTFESLTYNAGAGNDQFNVFSTAAQTPMTVNGGDGGDVFNVGGFGGIQMSLDNIAGALTLNGQGGSDTANFNDNNEPTSHAYTLSASAVQRDTPVPMNYGTVEAVAVHGGSAGDNVQVLSTAASTPLAVNGNGGPDVLRVFATAAPVTYFGGAGADDLFVNPDAGSPGDAPADVLIDQSDELLTLQVRAGGRVATSRGVTLVVRDFSTALGVGTIDLNGAMLLRNSATLNTAEIDALLTRGYAGGAWNGTHPGGAIHSTAAAGASPGDALGYWREATPPLSGVNGVSIGANDALIRYTLVGDTNLDLAVNLSDFSRAAANFNQAGRDWLRGDFNYDNVTGIADFSGLAANFNAVLARSASAAGESPFGERLIESLAELG